MNYSNVLSKFYGDKMWSCGDTYESLEWNDTTIPKPTEDELNLKWNGLLKDLMREERNQLLKESDYTVLPDFPSLNKQSWLDYRQQLRDFPSVWSVGMSFPTKPI